MSLPPLSAEQRVKPPRFELRMSVLFAALFVPVGIHLPYFPLWLDSIGFDAAEIGLILAAPMFFRLLTTPFVTSYADRASDRVHVLVTVVAGTFLISLGYFLPPSFGLILGVSLVIALFWTPMSPLADSVALSGVRRFGSDYARMRLWGSSAFLFANFAGGFVIASAGAASVPVMISAGLAVTLAAAMWAPRLGPPRKASPLSAADIQQAPTLLKPAFLLFVAGVGVINATHGFHYGFVSIYWSSLGMSEGVVGMLWAWSVVAEVAMFIVFRRVFGRTTASRLIAYAGIAAVLRWCAMPLIWPFGFGVAGFFAVQTLHAFTTGLILIGVQQMIARTVPEERTGAAQGVAFLANGFSMASVTLASGPIYAALGAWGFFCMAGLAVAGLVLIALGARTRQPQRAGVGGDTSEPV